ncbi:MAG: hypothetical protein DMF79_08395, partial [Acidobacteria bacterium]
PSPSPSPSAPPAIANPCTAALAAGGDVLPVVARSAASTKSHGGLGVDKRDPREHLWAHRLAALEGRVEARDVRAAAPPDVGDIAVIPDDGSLIISPNPFDLAGRGLRFQPNATGGYDVSRADASFRPNLGPRRTLADDDTFQAPIPFAFPFYGTPRTTAFVNSDGNITYTRGDTATDERGLARLLSGAPRVAPFFADLDPSAGGGVFVATAPDALTVTWCSVRGFESSSTVTAQASLLPDGSVEVKFGSVSLGDAIVAVSPGATGGFAPVDLQATGPTPGGAAAVGERYAAQARLDLVTTAQRFYQGHPDLYDQLVFWTDTRVVESGTFAFETTVKNAVRGIGADVVDFSREHGSAGQLGSLVLMDNLGKYPADPTARVPGVGENTTLTLLGQECGHRWLALLRFRDASGAASDLLLGRDLAHWSFFFDSDASFMEGNDIEDLGGGSFRTVATVQRYGPLDLYAMGVLEESEVPPFSLVETPPGTGETRESGPRTGVAFGGTRHDLTIADVVAALGHRDPPARQSPRFHRQAFVYVVGGGRSADPSATAKLERIRAAWEPFFTAGTGGRMTLDTRLR